MTRRTKKQVAADVLANQRQAMIVDALGRLRNAFAFADLDPPQLAMTRTERMKLHATITRDFFLILHADNFGTTAECAGVKIIERRTVSPGMEAGADIG